MEELQDENSGFTLFAPTIHKSTEQTLETIRKENSENVEISLPTAFPELGLSPWILKVLSALSIHKPNPIQSACIPAILSPNYNTLIGIAPTGSGKTAAFALPILEVLAQDPFGVAALVLTPTRELALQIADQFSLLGKPIGVQVVTIFGGSDLIRQISEIEKRPHVVISTPGRLADLLQGGSNIQKCFSQIKYVVLDEADRLLSPDASYAPSMKTIFDNVYSIKKLPKTLLFTATMSKDIGEFASFREEINKSDKSTVFKYSACSDEDEKYKIPKGILQRMLFLPSKVRETYLAYLLQHHFYDQTGIIFVGKCVTAELLFRTLTAVLRQFKQTSDSKDACSIPMTQLHSQMSQGDRIKAVNMFRNGNVKLLICTDVASRGLDIPSVSYVFNFDVPTDARDYVHRIGRCSRVEGQNGMAITIASELDIDLIRNIETNVGTHLSDYSPLPKEKEVIANMKMVLEAKRLASMALKTIGFGEKSKRNKDKWSKVAGKKSKSENPKTHCQL